MNQVKNPGRGIGPFKIREGREGNWGHINLNAWVGQAIFALSSFTSVVDLLPTDPMLSRWCRNASGHWNIVGESPFWNKVSCILTFM
jgi:hypothetical protein